MRARWIALALLAAAPAAAEDGWSELTLREPRLEAPDRSRGTLLFEWSAGAGALVGWTFLAGGVSALAFDVFNLPDDAAAALAGTMLLALPIATALPIWAIVGDAGGKPTLWGTVLLGYLGMLLAGLEVTALVVAADAGEIPEGVAVAGVALGAGAMLAIQVWGANSE